MGNLERALMDAKPRIERAVPKHITADYMIRAAGNALRDNPKLEECTEESFVRAVLRASQYGLPPDGFSGYGYLVSYNNKYQIDGREVWRKEAHFQEGYLGLLELARRTGDISRGYGKTVRERDSFEVRFGTEPVLSHTPAEGDRGDIVGAWCMIWANDGSPLFDYMSRKEIEYIRDTYSKQPDGQAWKKGFDPMCVKTVARRLIKWIPKSPELADKISGMMREDLIEGIVAETERQRAQVATIDPEALRPAAEPVNRGQEDAHPQAEEPPAETEKPKRQTKAKATVPKGLKRGMFSEQAWDVVYPYIEPIAKGKGQSVDQFLAGYERTASDLTKAAEAALEETAPAQPAQKELIKS